ncbi:MAG: SGNH/GDSL hydrolase family protein [Pseudomonadota bacterium]
MAGLPIPFLLPVIVPQALWVAARATRLPEAAGQRAGQVGRGRALRLLVLGDSSAAGVGVAHQDHALTGRLVHRLAAGWHVNWALHARSGATTTTALTMLDGLAGQTFDAAVLALGVNDVKNGMSAARWHSNYTHLLDALQTRLKVAHVYACGVPPLGSFPLLPRTLASVLGARAARFDTLLATLCADREGAQHLPFDMPFDPEFMAADGFHPGAALYDLWAGRVADAISADWRV